MIEPRIYNSRLIDIYLKLIRSKYPHVNIGHLLQQSGMELYEVDDQGTWFTQGEVNRFYEMVVKATGNENIAREAGRYAASPDALGTMRKNTLALLGPFKAFSLLGKLTENLTKSSDYVTRILDKNSVEVVVRPRSGVNEEKYQCQNRIGFFEAILSLFSYKSPYIEHKECIFNGNCECRYVIRWQPSSIDKIKKLRDFLGITLVLLNIVIVFAIPEIADVALSLSIIVLLGISLWLEICRKKIIEVTLEQLSDSSEKLTEQINLNYRNIQLTRQVGEVTTSRNNIDDVIKTVIQILETTLEYDRGLILLANDEAQRLEIRGAFGYSEEHLDILENTSFRLDNPNSQGPFTVCFRDKKPFLVNDTGEINVTSKSRQFIEALGTSSFLVVPIILENISIGIIAVDNQQRKKPLTNTDLNLLMSIAPTIGISFRNASLHEARENQFAATLKVLAQSIDARDFLTAGHSEKVAEYATGIAMELGKNYDYCQMIRTAALLHDYGKIGIPDTVLKKDGPLTDEERALIRTHSEKSRDILVQVPFDGYFKEIPLIALHHHERWDGNGYPMGLAGEAIPYGARIVAVADFYEAITAKRHYRDPMPTEIALDLLRKESGVHFDPDIVNVFLRYLGRNRSQPSINNNEAQSLPYLREPRFEYKASAQINIDEKIVNGVTVDISNGGVFFHCDSQFASLMERNNYVEMNLDLPNGRGVRVRGQVRWVNSSDGRYSKRHPIGVGVAFVDVNQNTKKIIKSALHKFIRGKGAVLYPQSSDKEIASI